MSGNGNGNQLAATPSAIQQIPAYSKIGDLTSWVEKTGEIIAKAQFFGCKTVEQGQAMALISVTEGISLLEIRRRYHVVGGNLDMRADYMRAQFRRIGGDYDWINDGDDGTEARMWVEYRGRKREVSYSMENAKLEGLVKKGSRWEKDPGSMLRARCSTKAIRMVASEVLEGLVTDEEREAITGVVADGNGVDGNGHDDTIDVPFTPANDQPIQSADPDAPPPPVDTSKPQQQPTASDPSTAEQREQIKALAQQAPDEIDLLKDMADLDVQAMPQILYGDAQRMIDKYSSIVAAKKDREAKQSDPPPTEGQAAQFAEEMSGSTKQRESAVSVSAEGPIDQAMISELSGLVKQLLPYEGDSYKLKIKQWIEGKTGKAGAKLSDLTYPLAHQLKDTLSKKLMGRRVEQ